MTEESSGCTPAVVSSEFYEFIERIVKPKQVTYNISKDRINVNTELEHTYVAPEEARVII